MSVSLKQIALRTNTSITTVSRVLRNCDQVSLQTRQRVLDAAKELKYRPNLLVRGIQQGKTKMIGVMVYPADMFLAHIFDGIHDELIQEDYVPIVLKPDNRNLGPQAPTELDQIHRLIDRRVDGIILRPIRDAASDAYLQAVWDHNIPMVAVDRQIPQTHADFVGSDDEHGAMLAAEHLLALGHRNVAHLAGALFTSPGRTRCEVFKRTILAAGGTCVVVEDQSFNHGEKEAQQLLNLNPRPTAIFAGNDIQARFIYLQARKQGLSIPEDLSVVGYADMPFAQDMQPALTTVAQNGKQIGQMAARQVLDRIDGKAEQGARIQLSTPALQIRQSTTICPAS